MRYFGRVAAAITLLSVLGTGAQAQTVWVLRNPITQGNTLQGVTWTGSGGILVAVGASGTIVTSPNGTDWTARGAGATTNTLWGVAASGSSPTSRIVAVGTAGTILWSTPGTIGTWTPASVNPVSQKLTAVTWTGTKFVAVGASGTIITSADGDQWDLRSSSQGVLFNGVASNANGSALVGVGIGGNIETSPDGIGWTQRTPTGTTNEFYAVASVGNSIFFAVGFGGVMKASTDGGITWSNRVSNAGTYLAGITTQGPRFVAVGNTGKVVTSVDGTTWTANATSITSQVLNAVTYMGDQYVAVGTGGVIITSPDGLVWSQVSSHVFTINSLAANGTQLLAAGDAGYIMTSTNGSTWTRQTSGTTSILYGATWTGTTWAVTGATNSTSKVYTSPDGATWTERTVGSLTNNFYALAGNNDTLVAVGSGGQTAFSVNAGSQWTPQSAVTNATFNGIAWYGGKNYVLVGVSGTPAGIIRTTANNGQSWTTRNPNTTNALYGVAYAGSLSTPLLVAVGQNGTILTAPASNPATWSPQTSGFPTTTLYSVTWTGTQFVAAGGGGLVLTSPDGTNWSPRTTGVTATLNSATWAPAPTSLVLVGGNGGNLITSSPTAVPPVPTQITPAAGATNVPVNPLFSWSTSSGATSYGMHVSNNALFSDTVIIDTTTASVSRIRGPLTPGATYHWRVRAVGTTGSSGWSSPGASFTVIGAGNAAPVLSSPAQAAPDVALPVTTQWATYAGAISYRHQVSTDSLFGSFAANDSLITTQRLLNNLSSNTVYYWRVFAYLPSGNTAWAPFQKFTTSPPAPNSAPVLNTPANNAIAVSMPTASLTWTALAGASAYQIQVSTDSNFTSLTAFRLDTVTSVTSATVSGLVTNGVYYWRVRGQNASGSGPYSTRRTFTTATAIPDVPVVVGPTNLSSNVDVFTSLAWNAAARAVTYHVQLSTAASNFSTFVVNDSTLTVVTRNPGQLADNTNYRWRVRAKNPVGVSAWTNDPHIAFMTGAAATQIPPKAQLILPTGFKDSVALMPSFRWTRPSTARSYRLQVSTSLSFATLVVNDSLSNATDTTRTITTGLASSTEYYWRVLAYNHIGFSTSDPQLFTTLAQAPAVPTLYLPDAFAFDVSISPTLTWFKVPGATSYRVQVSTSNTFGTLTVNDSITDTTRLIGPLAGNTDYYWKVRARNSAGVSQYSSAQRFTTGAVPLPAIPVLQLPGNFAESLAVTGTMLSWNAAAGAASYRVQVSTSLVTSGNGGAFTSGVFQDDSGLTTLSRAVTATLARGVNYYWHVSAKNVSGSSLFSSTFRFTTIPPVAILPGSIVLRNMAFGDGRSLRFGLPRADRVIIRVYDTRGNLVTNLLDEPRAAGYHTVALPAVLRGGVYLVDFRVGNYRASMKTQP